MGAIEADLHGSDSAGLMKVGRKGGENGGMTGVAFCSAQLVVIPIFFSFTEIKNQSAFCVSFCCRNLLG